MNAFIGIGRLERDPMIETEDDGTPFAILGLRIERGSGSSGRQTDTIVCQLIGPLAVEYGPRLRCGALIGVRGRLEADGSNIFVHVDEIQILGSRAVREAVHAS